MGDASIFHDSGKRGLYTITNSNTVVADTTKVLYQIDLPKIILDGANVNHNLKFLTDYISGDKDKYIQENIFALTEINTNGILNSKVEAFNSDSLVVSKKYQHYKRDTMRYTAHAGGSINDAVYTNSLEALDVNYMNGFRLFELDIIKTKDNHFVAAHDWIGWADMTEYKGLLPVSKKSFFQERYLGNILQWI